MFLSVEEMLPTCSASLLVSLLLLALGAHAGDYGVKNRHLKRPVPLERQSFNHQPGRGALEIADLPTAFDWRRISQGNGEEETSMLQPSW